MVRAGQMHTMEGDLSVKRMVIVEFESLDAARTFYESADYAPLLKVRKENTRSDLVFVEGYAGA